MVPSTWPILKSLEARLGNRRGRAVTLGMLLLLVIRLAAALGTIAAQSDDVRGLTRRVAVTRPRSRLLRRGVS